MHSPYYTPKCRSTPHLPRGDVCIETNQQYVICTWQIIYAPNPLLLSTSSASTTSVVWRTWSLLKSNMVASAVRISCIYASGLHPLHLFPVGQTVVVQDETAVSFVNPMMWLEANMQRQSIWTTWLYKTVSWSQQTAWSMGAHFLQMCQAQVQSRSILARRQTVMGQIWTGGALERMWS